MIKDNKNEGAKEEVVDKYRSCQPSIGRLQTFHEKHQQREVQKKPGLGLESLFWP